MKVLINALVDSTDENFDQVRSNMRKYYLIKGGFIFGLRGLFAKMGEHHSYQLILDDFGVDAQPSHTSIRNKERYDKTKSIWITKLEKYA